MKTILDDTILAVCPDGEIMYMLNVRGQFMIASLDKINIKTVIATLSVRPFAKSSMKITRDKLLIQMGLTYAYNLINKTLYCYPVKTLDSFFLGNDVLLF
jgi:hypothetical protein